MKTIVTCSIVLSLFLFGCQNSNHNIQSAERVNSSKYISLKSEFLDSIGFTYYDKKQILYDEDSTFIIFPDKKDLVFYHFESRQEVQRISFSIEVENAESFNVASTNDMVVYYGGALIRNKNKEETIFEFADQFPERYISVPWSGIEYFPDQQLVILASGPRSMPHPDSLSNYLNGLCAYNMNDLQLTDLPFKYSQIYRKPEFYGAELCLSRKGDTLVVSENWGENVYIINIIDGSLDTVSVRHPNEKLLSDLPANLSKYSDFMPAAGESKTEKKALWELRHFYFEKYLKAFLSYDGRYIYRIYQGRLPVNKSLDYTRSDKEFCIIRYDISSTNVDVFPAPSKRFFVGNGFWMSPKSMDYIKYLDTKGKNHDKAIYILDRIAFYDI